MFIEVAAVQQQLLRQQTHRAGVGAESAPNTGMFGPDAGKLILSVAITQVVVCCTDSRNMSALRPVSGPPTIIFD